MSWRTITSDEVLEEFTPQETATLKGIQGAEDKLPAILGRVIRTVRGKIQAGGSTVGDEGTVPDQLAMEVVDLARWRWLVSFPQLKALQSADRKAAHEKALEALRLVEKGEVAVEDPSAGAGEAASGVASPSFGDKTRTFRREDEDGI